jgi:hypothetical protein
MGGTGSAGFGLASIPTIRSSGTSMFSVGNAGACPAGGWPAPLFVAPTASMTSVEGSFSINAAGASTMIFDGGASPAERFCCAK